MSKLTPTKLSCFITKTAVVIKEGEGRPQLGFCDKDSFETHLNDGQSKLLHWTMCCVLARVPWAVPVGNHLFLSHFLLLCPVTLGYQPQTLILVSTSHCPGTGNWEQGDPVPSEACPFCIFHQCRETQVRNILHTLLFSADHCWP